jgi:AMIN domain-containing protein
MLARMVRALPALSMLVTLLAGAAAARAQGDLGRLTEATVVEREGAVEVWVRLSRTARYHAELMDQPYRLVLDFDDTAYRWTTKAVAVVQEPLRELRGSQYRKGVARLVVELRRPAIYTIEQDREGLRIIFAREKTAIEPPARTTPRAPSPRPLVYGIVMLDAEAHAYIFDPALRQVRRYRVGDAVGESVIETIGERHVVLKTPSGRVELRVEESRPDPGPTPSPR